MITLKVTVDWTTRESSDSDALHALLQYCSIPDPTYRCGSDRDSATLNARTKHG